MKKRKEERLKALFGEIDAAWGRRGKGGKGGAHKTKEKPLVFGSGSLDSGIMVIGEAPGRDETRLGVPFVGRAGSFFVAILEEVLGMKRGALYITNAVKVWPTIETKRLRTRPPGKDEAGFFLPYLEKEIEIVSPKAIIAVGKTAFKALLPSGDFAPYRWFKGDSAVPVMPVYHPAYILRRQKEMKKNVALLKAALRKVRSRI